VHFFCVLMPGITTHTNPEFVLFLFGPFRLELRHDGACQIIHLPRRKVESLLAYLACHFEPGGHSRDKLAALFWGDTPDEQARTSLRTALAVLRKTFGATALLTDRERVQ